MTEGLKTMLEILESRKKDLENRIRQLDRKGIHGGIFDAGELDAREVVEYFALNFRLRIYDGEIMNSDDPATVRNYVADLIAKPKTLPEISFSGISSRAESLSECEWILTAIGKE